MDDGGYRPLQVRSIGVKGVEAWWAVRANMLPVVFYLWLEGVVQF